MAKLSLREKSGLEAWIIQQGYQHRQIRSSASPPASTSSPLLNQY